MKFSVNSEVGKLKKVLIHKPNLSIERLTPSNCERLLFDDVLDVKRAGEEHDAFAEVLKGQGIDVYFLHQMLTETIENDEARDWIIKHQINSNLYGIDFDKQLKSYLKELPAQQLSSAMIGGMTYEEFVKSNSFSDIPLFARMLEPTDFIIPPKPNHLFTRDTSCWVYDGVSVNPMAKPARLKETYNLKVIYKYHPMFKDHDFNVWYGEEDKNYEHATIEGGDVLVLGRGVVLIGTSERTTPQGIEALAKSILAKGSATKIIVVELPKHRSCMHLDTVMTMLNENTFTVFPRIISDDVRSWTLTFDGNLRIAENKNFIDSIKDALQVDAIDIIPTGGTPAQKEREQWNDANNVLTLAPNIVVGYAKNDHTNDKLEEAGVTVLRIPGDELGRGRGGARCMSCPLDRDGI